jgi:hypothetical protein
LGSQDLIGAVFAEAPEKYRSVLNITAKMKGEGLDIDGLENAMYKLWRQGDGKPRGDDDSNEMVLSAFTGTCYMCKGQGRKATYCPKKGGGRGGGGGRGYQGRVTFMGTCKQCGKFGHNKGGCWELETNRDTHRNGYRNQGEKANLSIDNADDKGIEFVMVTVSVLDRTVLREYEVLKLEDALITAEYEDVVFNNEPTVHDTVLTVIQKDEVKDKHTQCFETDMVEVALVGMEFPDSMHLLSDPNIWIGDTAASVHTSPYKHGMVPENESKDTGSITVGNGISENRQCMKTLPELCVTSTVAQWDEQS